MYGALDRAVYRRGFAALPVPLDYRGHKCNYAICPHDSEVVVRPCSPGKVTSLTHGDRVINGCGGWDCEF